jgi:hypothetical protein
VNAGEVKTECVEIAGGGVAGTGDRVVTRQNDRRLTAGRGWVKNGDTWTVQDIGRDGSLRVHREHDDAHVFLPAGYVHSHVELGYAATAHRAQGRTVDTAHSLVTAASTRESLYVSATRGRTKNTIYVDTDGDPDPETSHEADTSTDPRELLDRVLERTHADTSAHAVLERDRQLVQELEDRDLACRAALTDSLTVTGRQANRSVSRSRSIVR